MSETPSIQGPGLVWLASYPKSGNTWLRFMLAAAMFGPPEESIEVARRIPDLHRPVPGAEPAAELELMKTHFMLSDAHPRLAETVGAIHIVRNPRDIALSALNYRKLTGESARAFTAAGYLRKFISTGGDPDWLRLGFGSWARQNESWRTTDRFPVLALRYEDLKEDARGALERMLAFLRLDLGEDRIRDAVRASSFEAMRALEIREKAKPVKDAQNKRLFVGDTKAARKGVYFVNKGESGQSLAGIDPALDRAFDEAFGPTMRSYGYSS